MLPIGVSVCVAGSYVLTSKKPTLMANLISFNKQAIIDKYKSPFIVLTVLQLLCGGFALWAGWQLYKAERRQDELHSSYEGRVVEVGKECKICWTNPCDVILEPCGHLGICRECAEQLTTECPFCRKAIHSKRVIFAE